MCVGGYIRSVLQEPDFRGRVLASLSQAIYFTGPAGELGWIVQPDQPAHRRAILAAFDLSKVRDGARLWLEEDQLVIENAGRVSLAGASTWSSPRWGPHPVLPWDELRAGLRPKLAGLRDLPEPRGLGRALALALDKAFEPPGEGSAPLERALWQVAYRPVCEVIDACREGDPDRILDAGSRLIGLGPGLTPAGDDYLGGMLFAGHHLRLAYGDRVRWNPTLGDALVARARAESVGISAVLLEDLSQGHGPEPVHALVQSLLFSEAPSRVHSSAVRLIQIGHSSGWDLLAGLAAGLSLVPARQEDEAVHDNHSKLRCRRRPVRNAVADNQELVAWSQ